MFENGMPEWVHDYQRLENAFEVDLRAENVSGVRTRILQFSPAGRFRLLQARTVMQSHGMQTKSLSLQTNRSVSHFSPRSSAMFTSSTMTARVLQP